MSWTKTQKNFGDQQSGFYFTNTSFLKGDKMDWKYFSINQDLEVNNPKGSKIKFLLPEGTKQAYLLAEIRDNDLTQSVVFGTLDNPFLTTSIIPPTGHDNFRLTLLPFSSVFIPAGTYYIQFAITNGDDETLSIRDAVLYWKRKS